MHAVQPPLSIFRPFDSDNNALNFESGAVLPSDVVLNDAHRPWVVQTVASRYGP